MIRPDETLLHRPNLDTLRGILERYTDQILALEFASGAKKVEVVYSGEHYSMMKYMVRTIIGIYAQNNWIVTDTTGNRKLMYILEFKAKNE